MLGAITSFKNEYAFLSNFEPVDIWFENRFYDSVEHAYVASKSENDLFRERIAGIVRNLKTGEIEPERQPITPNEAKRLGRRVKLRTNWEQIKYLNMRYFVRQKFIFYPEFCK